LNENSFIREYRVDPSGFDHLIQLLTPRLSIDETMAQRSMNQTKSLPITVASRVGAGLIMLSGGRYMESMRTHGMSKALAYANFHRFIDAVNSCEDLAIRFDNQPESLAIQASGFKARSTHELFEYCCGAIDGLAIKIKCPSNVLNQSHYYSGSKKFYCLNMQAVCDSNCLFTAISMKHVGTTNDNIAFGNSSLIEMASSLQFPYHWVGDQAYIDSSSMITPYEGVRLHITHPPKDWFNFWHSQIRITIERCFGIFVRRWGILWQPIRYDLHVVFKIVHACCRLHNFCMRRRIGVCCLGADSMVNDQGVLENIDWRDVPRDEDSMNSLRCGNPLKDRFLEVVPVNSYSHSRNIN
jgi:hypothetical protein